GIDPCLQFRDTRGGLTSAPLTVAVKSESNVKLTVSAVTIAGDDAAAFATTELGGKSVPAGSTLQIPVTFSPAFTPGDAVHPWDSAAREEWFGAKLVIATDDPKHPTLL